MKPNRGVSRKPSAIHFEGFEFISSRWIGVSNRFRPPMSLELLHELLHEIASTKSAGAPQIWRDKLSAFISGAWTR